MKNSFFLLPLLVLLQTATFLCNQRVVVLVSPSGDEVSSYVAVLYKNKHHIIVDPPIKASILRGRFLGSICGFTLHERNVSVPVHIQLKDPKSGAAELVFNKNISGTSSGFDHFDFDISAFDCDSPVHASIRVPVMMKVKQYEEPQFDSSSYSTSISADLPIGSKVLRLHAYEPFKSALVCKYEISGPSDSAFDVNDNGVIRLAKDLKHIKEKQHTVLRVTAVDCNVPDRRKSTISVNIVIHPVSDSVHSRTCNSFLNGLPSHFDFSSAVGIHFFAEKANIQSCFKDTGTCDETDAIARISLTTSLTRQSCGLDHQSLLLQRKLCESDKRSIDLIHSVAPTDRGCSGECCQTLDKHATYSPHYFNGKTSYLNIPSSVLPSDHHLGSRFTLHFWLKHGPMPSHAKEQILCNSDNAKHNRHHYSVFLHNCKLILLLRREFAPRNSLKHAEWRYKLSEVCDSNWHHYSLTFFDDQLKLQVDGRIFVHTASNPQIMDDYVLHKATDASTRLTVGACWHSGRKKYEQLLRGSLSGLVVLRQEIEPDRVLRCLSQCQEKLDFHAVSQMKPGMSLSLNSDMTMIEIKGHNLSEVVNLLRQVGYINVGNHYDKSAKSQITINMKVSCRSPNAKVNINPVKVRVTRKTDFQSNGICLKGANLIRVSNEALTASDGVPIFVNFGIGVDKDLKLDSCLMRSENRFTAVERIIWPVGDASKLGIAGRATTVGLILDGESSAGNYEAILKQIRYQNKNPILQHRTFIVSCSLLGGKVVSNEFPVKLAIFYKPVKTTTVKKQLPDPPAVPGSMRENKNLDILLDDIPSVKNAIVRNKPFDHPELSAIHHAKTHGASVSDHHINVQDAVNFRKIEDRNSSAGAVTVVAISIGFVLFIIGLVIFRWRRSRSNNNSYSSPNKNFHIDADLNAEMEWDNTALNITVNPLEKDNGLSDSESECQDEFVDELDMDGSSSSCPDDDEDFDEMTSSVLNQKCAQIASSEDELEDECHLVTGPAAIRGSLNQQLEWDDSSLPRPSPRRANSRLPTAI